MANKRILLMYISKVSGHRQATVAIQKSLKALDPDIEVQSINGFGYTYPVLEAVINKMYMGIIRYTPQVWEYLYDNPKFAKRFSHIQDFLHKASHKKLAKLIEDFKPDVVVCTQAFPCGMVADYKITHHIPMKVVGVLTDHAPHLYWVHKGIDALIVPSEQARTRYLEEGLADKQIKVFGIPIRMKFTETIDRNATCKKLNLDPSIPTILVMGGGQGLGPIKEAVKSLIYLKRPLQLIVICGTNVKLVHWLKKSQRQTDKKIIFYDYANNVDELMAVSSLIVTKPGGMTTSECLAKGLPMVVVDPIPGQEERNAQFLESNGIAMRVDDKRRIGEHIDALLNDAARLQSMRQAALKLSKPQAADDVAQFVLKLS